MYNLFTDTAQCGGSESCFLPLGKLLVVAKRTWLKYLSSHEAGDRCCYTGIACYSPYDGFCLNIGGPASQCPSRKYVKYEFRTCSHFLKLIANSQWRLLSCERFLIRAMLYSGPSFTIRSNVISKTTSPTNRIRSAASRIFPPNRLWAVSTGRWGINEFWFGRKSRVYSISVAGCRFGLCKWGLR